MKVEVGMSKKLFMITYGFPPKGGGGIQRNVKFLKFLQRLGWETAVLTVSETDFYVFDETMLEELGDTEVIRAGSVDPLSLSAKAKKWIARTRKGGAAGKKTEKQAKPTAESAWYVSVYRVVRDWCLVPDAYSGWIPFALLTGRKAIKRNRPDVIFCSFPSASNAIVAYYLSKWFRIPLCIDYRDAWQDDPYVKYPSRLHKWYHAKWERRLMSNAAFATVYGEPLKKVFEKRYPQLKGKVHVITNGFDPEDFEGLSPRYGGSEKRRLIYSGAVFVDRRETFTVFTEAVKKLPLEVREKLEVVFVGVAHGWATELIESQGLSDIVSFTGYKAHSEALSYLVGGNGALMFLAAGDKVALTGKVFEYIGARLPIVACVEPDGACAELLGELGMGAGVCSPSDANAICEVLKRFSDGGLPHLAAKDISAYSRKVHADKLARLVETNILNVAALDD